MKKIILTPNPYRDKNFSVVRNARDILQEAGFEVKNSDFFRIGIPFTLSAVMAGYIFIWIFWGM